MGVKVLPALFNSEMVLALLDNRKTATRRLVKPQPRMVYYDGLLQDSGEDTRSGRPFYVLIAENQNGAVEQIVPPYQPGDIIYVRETFRIDYLSNIPGSGRIHYKADDSYADFNFSADRYEMMRRAQLKPGWRPNENMPREAARIFLRVKSVRAEPLRDISEEQAQAEGLYKGWSRTERSSIATTAKQAFMWVWASTIRLCDLALYGWAANPWVWVIEFERCAKPDGWPMLNT